MCDSTRNQRNSNMRQLVSVLIIIIVLNGMKASDQCTNFRCSNRLLENVINSDIKYSNLEQRLRALETHNEELQKDVQRQQTQIENSNTTFLQLQETNEENKAQIIQLKGHNKELQDQIVRLTGDVEYVSEQNLHLNNTLQNMQVKLVRGKECTPERINSIEDLQIEFAQVKKEVNKTLEDMHLRFNRLEGQNQELNATVRLHADKETSRDLLAFTARLSLHMLYTSESNIVFDYVVTNVGNGYYNNTGTFISPSEGLYIFALTIFTWKAFVRVDLMKNMEILGRVYPDGKSSESYDTASAIVVTALEIGDMVYAKYKTGSTKSDYVMHNLYSQFSGFKPQ